MTQMDMKTRILKRLRQSSDYISGQEICDDLGISRTAVWKYINQLKNENYEIQSVQNKGYKISSYPDILTVSEIESQLSDNTSIKKVIFYDETDSTNNQAKKAAENGEQDGTLFITECQTGGRGRRGRQWISPAGSGIWMSHLLRPDFNPDRASMLTIVAVMSITSAIKDVLKKEGCSCDCCIKWPNDIVLNKKKICGILTEMSAELEQIHYVVIGTGINVNTEKFSDEIKDMASSLYVETGKRIKRSDIVVKYSEKFAQYYKTFIKTQDLSGLIEEYNSMLVNKGNQVMIKETNNSYKGTAIGINKFGALLIEKEDGTQASVASGEVSVRGLYGYV